MYFLDANVCVAAMRPDISGAAEATRTWVQDALTGHEAVGLCEVVLSAMVRLVTNPRVFRSPASPAQALEFADALRGAPSALAVRPGDRHWSIFRDLVTTQRLRGNDIPDAYLASAALEAGATMVSLDQGFARFPQLRLVDPSRT